jgi:hypothetical protein
MTSQSASPTKGWRRREPWAATVVTLAALLASSHAFAQSSDPVELTWHAPPGCPRAADVAARIRKLAGSPNPGETPLEAEATIKREADGKLHLQLSVRAGDLVGTRNIAGGSCEDLAGAAAVTLVLILRSGQPLGAAALDAPSLQNPESAETSSRSEAPTQESAEASVGSEPQPHAAQDPTSTMDAPSTRNWRALLQAPLLSFALGPLPRPSFGVALAGGVWFDRWRVLGQGNAWLGQALPVMGPAGVGVHVDHIQAGVAVCRTFPSARFELAPCLNVSLEHIWAHGTGTHVAAQTAESTWVAAGVAMQARLRLSESLGLVASVDAQVEASRPRLSIEGVGRLAQLAPAALRIVIGTEWIL